MLVSALMTYREQAIEALRLARDAAGGWTNIARPLGISPADRVLAVEKATGVSRHKLRPDVFGEMPEAAE